jgi:hypothetical protein
MKIERALGVSLSAGLVIAAGGACGVACDVYMVRAPAPPRRVVVQAAPPAPAGPLPARLPASPARPGRVIAFHAHGASTAPAPSCLDGDAADPGDCSAMQSPDPTCAPPATARQKCAAVQSYFAPKVAAAAVACMTALTARQACDPAQSDLCATGALALACLDPSVRQLCSIATTVCKTTAGECAAIVSGLNDHGKEQVAQCVSQGCTGGLSACIQAFAR